MTRLWGLYGRPWIDLGPFLDLDADHLERLDREIVLGLSRVRPSWTGGTLKWMGVVAPWMMDDGFLDAMQAIEEMSPGERADFIALSEDTAHLDPADETLTFGDETDHPFTEEQARLLSYRHGAYFPWKVVYHLLENDRWEDKHSGAGKRFGDEARSVFPDTVAFIERLPFVEIGRAVIFGLEPNDHAPLHRDSEPGVALQVAQSISLAPRAGKRFYLQNDPAAAPEIIDARAYWFNDADYHGVLPDPHFRYSLRVDGVFAPDFLRTLERELRRPDRG